MISCDYFTNICENLILNTKPQYDTCTLNIYISLSAIRNYKGYNFFYGRLGLISLDNILSCFKYLGVRRSVVVTLPLHPRAVLIPVYKENNLGAS